VLGVIGDVVQDVVVWQLEEIRAATDTKAEITMTRGGSAANVAAFAAPRHPTRFIGCVGDDLGGLVLTQELKTLLVRTYSNALTQYRNQQIDFKPLKAKPEDTDVLVRTEVRQPGAKAVQIDYNLEKLADGWKVYDVLVAGVSLVTNYRDDFGKEVRAGGIDGLIKYLKDKNKQLDTPATAKK